MYNVYHFIFSDYFLIPTFKWVGFVNTGNFRVIFASHAVKGVDHLTEPEAAPRAGKRVVSGFEIRTDGRVFPAWTRDFSRGFIFIIIGFFTDLENLKKKSWN